VPLLARVYPNGKADVNHFHAAGGMGFLIRELLDAGLLHADVKTVWGDGPRRLYAGAVARRRRLALARRARGQRRRTVLRGGRRARSAEGGLRLLTGQPRPRGHQDSAVKPEHRVIEAPARSSTPGGAARRVQGRRARPRRRGVRFQGPRANGMPELHKLTPPLGVLQDRGHRVALVTDGRMSGASGKVPAAIHVTPERANGGAIGRVRDGDVIRVDAEAGTRASFGVSPGLTRELIAAAATVPFPLLPGVMTPSELILAREAGFSTLKLFPALQAGGIGMLKALHAVFPDVAFCPTGGITRETAPSFLQLPNVLCVGGSWVVPDDAVQAGDWGRIEALARDAAGLAAR
jgi:Entner-Doudoroff aldolase